MTDHLEESEVGVEDVVEVDLRIEPGVVQVFQGVAFGLVGDQRDVQYGSILVLAAAESSSEKIHPHDAEDEPEDEADQEYVADGWDRLDQSVDDHLHNKQPVNVT